MRTYTRSPSQTRRYLPHIEFGGLSTPKLEEVAGRLGLRIGGIGSGASAEERLPSFLSLLLVRPAVN